MVVYSVALLYQDTVKPKYLHFLQIVTFREMIVVLSVTDGVNSGKGEAAVVATPIANVVSVVVKDCLEELV